ncbi:hypothetical protein [Hymenobacter volaticus]|uniref:Tail specific protease domain-containing protein n=1 Tax=Hymenobacter volaticus TaxID=2932254 RepID=A0ABY4GDH1_9BACT|nr:hypothetical protein [Hymenobacter volaticus]UOQ68898.1 hypothetical protein MUN86_24635 [Hymenobacter volaticus]
MRKVPALFLPLLARHGSIPQLPQSWQPSHALRRGTDSRIVEPSSYGRSRLVKAPWLICLQISLLSAALLLATPTVAQPTVTPLTPAQWRQDLQMALDSFPRKDRSFSSVALAAYRTRVSNLRDSVEQLSAPQLMMGLARAVALSGNAHTRLYLLRNRSVLRRYPVRLWWFADGLYIVKATPDYAHLLGARVERLAGYKPADARRLVAPLFAGNTGWTNYMSTYTLTSPEVLRGLNLIGADDLLELEVKDRRGQLRRLTVPPLAWNPGSFVTEAWWGLAPRHAEPSGPWVSALAADSLQQPIYLQWTTRPYGLQYLPAEQALYLQYNRAGEWAGHESFADFGCRVLAAVQTRKPKRIIIDLRFNTGGNLQVAGPVFDKLIAAAKAQSSKLYVLSGPATFSAGLYHLAQLRLGGATIVGEPAGEGLDYWSEGGNMVLPNSGLSMHYADRFHSYSSTPHPLQQPYLYLDLDVPSLAPNLLIRLTAKEYFAGHDPLLAAALRHEAGSSTSRKATRPAKGAATSKLPDPSKGSRH